MSSGVSFTLTYYSNTHDITHPISFNTRWHDRSHYKSYKYDIIDDSLGAKKKKKTKNGTEKITLFRYRYMLYSIMLRVFNEPMWLLFKIFCRCTMLQV